MSHNSTMVFVMFPLVVAAVAAGASHAPEEHYKYQEYLSSKVRLFITWCHLKSVCCAHAAI
jgi:hypothetical protein